MQLIVITAGLSILMSRVGATVLETWPNPPVRHRLRATSTHPTLPSGPPAPAPAPPRLARGGTGGTARAMAVAGTVSPGGGAPLRLCCVVPPPRSAKRFPESKGASGAPGHHCFVFEDGTRAMRSRATASLAPRPPGRRGRPGARAARPEAVCHTAGAGSGSRAQKSSYKLFGDRAKRRAARPFAVQCALGSGAGNHLCPCPCLCPCRTLLRSVCSFPLQLLVPTCCWFFVLEAGEVRTTNEYIAFL